MSGPGPAGRYLRLNFMIGSLPAGICIPLQASASPCCFVRAADASLLEPGAFGSGSYTADPPHAKERGKSVLVSELTCRRGVGGGSETSQVGVAAEKGAEIILTWLPYPLGGKSEQSPRWELPENKLLKTRACWGEKPALGLTHGKKTTCPTGFVPTQEHSPVGTRILGLGKLEF